MKNLRALVALAVLLTAAAGCTTTHYHLASGAAAAPMDEAFTYVPTQPMMNTCGDIGEKFTLASIQITAGVLGGLAITDSHREGGGLSIAAAGTSDNGCVGSAELRVRATGEAVYAMRARCGAADCAIGSMGYVRPGVR
jgi:hypothetical protein